MTEKKKYTDFALAIARYLASDVPINGIADTWEIAQNVFPEKWKRPKGRGALIGHIDRVAYRHEEDFHRIPPEDMHGSAKLSLTHDASILKHVRHI